MSETARIGHVHLKVSDLERSVAFYRDVLGLELQQYYGRAAAFLSYGGYHHHIGLNVWESQGGSPPPRGSTGLYHTAFLFPTREALSRAVRRAMSQGVEISGAADHGVSEAIYFSDPDGNGIEIYWDRPTEVWPMRDGKVAMVSDPLDLDDLLAMTEAAK